MLQDAPHPFVINSRRRISHRTMGCFVKVLLAQMCHNPSSEGITEDVDHGPEPITDKEEGGQFHIATKSLNPSTVMFEGLTEPSRWPQLRRCQQAVIPQM